MTAHRLLAALPPLGLFILACGGSTTPPPASPQPSGFAMLAPVSMPEIVALAQLSDEPYLMSSPWVRFAADGGHGPVLAEVTSTDLKPVGDGFYTIDVGTVVNRRDSPNASPQRLARCANDVRNLAVSADGKAYLLQTQGERDILLTSTPGPDGEQGCALVRSVPTGARGLELADDGTFYSLKRDKEAEAYTHLLRWTVDGELPAIPLVTQIPSSPWAQHMLGVRVQLQLHDDWLVAIVQENEEHPSNPAQREAIFRVHRNTGEVQRVREQRTPR